MPRERLGRGRPDALRQRRLPAAPAAGLAGRRARCGRAGPAFAAAHRLADGGHRRPHRVPLQRAAARAHARRGAGHPEQLLPDAGRSLHRRCAGAARAGGAGRGRVLRLRGVGAAARARRAERRRRVAQGRPLPPGLRRARRQPRSLHAQERGLRLWRSRHRRRADGLPGAADAGCRAGQRHGRGHALRRLRRGRAQLREGAGRSRLLAPQRRAPARDAGRLGVSQRQRGVGHAPVRAGARSRGGHQQRCRRAAPRRAPPARARA